VLGSIVREGLLCPSERERARPAYKGVVVGTAKAGASFGGGGKPHIPEGGVWPLIEGGVPSYAGVPKVKKEPSSIFGEKRGWGSREESGGGGGLTRGRVHQSISVVEKDYSRGGRHPPLNPRDIFHRQSPVRLPQRGAGGQQEERGGVPPLRNTPHRAEGLRPSGGKLRGRRGILNTGTRKGTSLYTKKNGWRGKGFFRVGRIPANCA